MGPLIFINVLDPDTHLEETGGTASLTPANGRIVITSAESIVLDSVVVGTKVKGTDYTIAYDFNKKTITIAEITSGALGIEALAITYDIIDPSAVDSDDVIGSSDGLGVNKGIYTIQNVYQETGYIPSMLLVPGFSSLKAVHDAMYLNTQKVNGHWDVYMYRYPHRGQRSRCRDPGQRQHLETCQRVQQGQRNGVLPACQGHG